MMGPRKTPTSTSVSFGGLACTACPLAQLRSRLWAVCRWGAHFRGGDPCSGSPRNTHEAPHMEAERPPKGEPNVCFRGLRGEVYMLNLIF